MPEAASSEVLPLPFDTEEPFPRAVDDSLVTNTSESPEVLTPVAAADAPDRERPSRPAPERARSSNSVHMALADRIVSSPGKVSFLEPGDKEGDMLESENEQSGNQQSPSQRSGSPVLASELQRSMSAISGRSGISLASFRRSPTDVLIGVQRDFHTKTFGLLTAQFAGVFVIAFGLEMQTEPVTSTGWLLFAIGLFSIILISLLYRFSSQYPLNYLILLIITLTAGLFWRLACWFFTVEAVMILVGIMGMSSFFATLGPTFVRNESIGPYLLLWMSVGAGWLGGSAAFAFIVLLSDASHLALLTGTISSFCLFSLFLLAASRMLTQCDPDDFMKVIVYMDAFLLVVVSIPVFIIASYLMCGALIFDLASSRSPRRPPAITQGVV